MMDWLLDLLRYDPQAPLLFVDLFFWGFFAVALLGLAFLQRKMAMRNAYLFAISLFFYYKVSGLFLLLLVFSTVSDYLIGHAMHRTDTTWKRKMWLFASVFVNLGLLFYFKYAYFLADFFSDAFGLLWGAKALHGYLEQCDLWL